MTDRITVVVAGGIGLPPMAIKAEATDVPGLVIHPRVIHGGRPGAGWTVTHVRSGAAIVHVWDRETVLTWIPLLASCGNWDRGTLAIKSDIALVHAVRTLKKGRSDWFAGSYRLGQDGEGALDVGARPA